MLLGSGQCCCSGSPTDVVQMELPAPAANGCRQYSAVPALTRCLVCTCGVESSGQDEKHLLRWNQIKVKQHVTSQRNSQLSGQRHPSFPSSCVQNWKWLGQEISKNTLKRSALLFKLSGETYTVLRNFIWFRLFFFFLQFTSWLFLQQVEVLFCHVVYQQIEAAEFGRGLFSHLFPILL